MGLEQWPDDVPASLPFDFGVPPVGGEHRGMVMRSVDAGAPGPASVVLVDGKGTGTGQAGPAQGGSTR